MASSAELTELDEKRAAVAKLEQLLALFENPTPEDVGNTTVVTKSEAVRDLLQDLTIDERIGTEVNEHAATWYGALRDGLDELKDTIQSEIDNYVTTDVEA